MVTFEDFLSGLRLESNPFAKTNAAQEDRLGQYFVRPKYFTTLQGDPTQPSSSTVFAPRGSGKTAQKIMLERFCPDAKVLPISYDHFPLPSGSQDPTGFTVDYHLNNVLRQGILAMIVYMIEVDIGAPTLRDQNRKNLASLADEYVGRMAVDDIDSFTSSLLGRTEKLKKFWNEWRVVGTALLMPLLNKIGINELPPLSLRSTMASQPKRHHWEIFKSIAEDLGFRSIYVLIDRIDETQWTGNNAERSYQLVANLLRDLPLLDDPFVGWKFFVWDAIEELCRADARPDRIEQFRLVWEDGDLREMTAKRLSAYSNGGIKDFGDLLASDARQFGRDTHDWLTLFANRSPRNVVRMGNDVLSEQAERDAAAKRISLEALEAGVTKFCEYSIEEQYPREHLRSMRRIGRSSFTISHLASAVYKEHVNSTRNRVRGWEESGIATRNGTIKLEAGVKPHNYYMITDPRVVRYIYERRSIQDVLEINSRRCTHCQRLIFSEFEDREDDFVCPHCERDALSTATNSATGGQRGESTTGSSD